MRRNTSASGPFGIQFLVHLATRVCVRDRVRDLVTFASIQYRSHMSFDKVINPRH